MQTELTLSIGGLPPMSARGCVQELKPLSQGEFKRTINGELIFIGNQHHKYYSKISCADQKVMATEGLQVGSEVKVGCIQPLCQKVSKHTESQKVQLERIPVQGHVFIIDEKGKKYENFVLQGQEVIIPPQAQDLFIFYHPKLDMRVISFTLKTDEWKMTSGWTLELEEI